MWTDNLRHKKLLEVNIYNKMKAVDHKKIYIVNISMIFQANKQWLKFFKNNIVT